MSGIWSCQGLLTFSDEILFDFNSFVNDEILTHVSDKVRPGSVIQSRALQDFGFAWSCCSGCLTIQTIFNQVFNDRRISQC